jgi:AGZA family xanthine/uracil permease-like MFS transporter
MFSIVDTVNNSSSGARLLDFCMLLVAHMLLGHWHCHNCAAPLSKAIATKGAAILFATMSNEAISDVRRVDSGTLRRFLDSYFCLTARSTTVKREILAGLTTFATMAYILVVNASILSKVGISYPVLISVTALSSAIMTAAMGLVSNYPLALAPGMGSNAFIAFTVCQMMGISWQSALGLVFYNGVIFFVLALTGARELIIKSIPPSLKIAISAGIGLFIALIGLRTGGVLTGDAAHFINISPLLAPNCLLIYCGLILSCVLFCSRVRGALVIGIMVITVAGLFVGSPGGHGTITEWPKQIVSMPTSIESTFMQLDLGYLWTHFAQAFPIVLVLFFGDFMSGMATTIAVCERAGFAKPNGEIPGFRKTLAVDAVAACVGACIGTSTMGIYVESAAGVEEGGRTGLTSLTVAGCFAASLFLTPLISVIPAVATAPALVMVGVLMMQSIVSLNLRDVSVAMPAVLAILVMALVSVSYGIALGLVLHVLMMLGMRRFRELHWLTIVLAALFLLNLIFS